MKRNRFSEEQIVRNIEGARGGHLGSLAQHGLSDASIYTWKAKHGGMEATVTYSYDLAGHPIGISDNSASILAPAGAVPLSVMTMGYDALNEMVSTSFSPVLAQAPPTSSTATFTYGYDATNRRISQATSDNSYWSYPSATAFATSYTANNLDQYSAIGSVTPAYDGNGNLTYDGTFTYGYDAESRLISASGAGNTASYAYDTQGRRKSKTVNGTTTIFVQDPQGCALLDYNGSSGAILNWYVFGLGQNDELNQMNVAGSTRATYVPDIQGSIIASLDAASGTLTKAGYQPFGESGSISSTFGYTGARIDAETGLYDFRGRMYTSKVGRFLQTDPIGVKGGINLYAYVNNDPLNNVDPLGLYTVVLVTWPNGSQYVPMTNVKNSAQAANYGQPIGTSVPIAVPPNLDPQAPVNFWSSTIFKGPIPFAYYWQPGGPNDYKLQNPMYDAFGNFEYGATGSAAGYSTGTLTGIADLLHGGTNNPINTQDITSGANAISNGGTLSTIDSSQIVNNGSNASSNGGNASTIDSGQNGSVGGK